MSVGGTTTIKAPPAKSWGRREDCHYGWVMLVACTLATAASGTGHSFSIAPFVDGWMDLLRISRHTFSGIWTLTMLVSCLVSPFAGQLIDRHGSRRVLLLCIVPSIGSILWLSMMKTPVELSLAVTVNRIINADTLPLIGVTTLNRWFVKHRGRASTALGLVWAWLLEFPGVELKLIHWLGASGADLAVAAYVVLLVLICSVLWKDSPESVGLLPDFARPADEDRVLEKAPLGEAPAAANKSGDSEVSFTRRQATQTIMFWAVVLMQFSQNTLWQGCHLHLLDVLLVRGVDAAAAGGFYTAVAVARTATSLLFSCVIMDRLGRKSYLTIAMSTVPQLLVTLLLIGALGPKSWQPSMAIVLGFLYGIWGGMVTAASNVVYAQLFGRAHLGAITGLATGCMRVSGIIGPLLFGLARDWTGSYNLPLKSVMAFTLVAAAILIGTPMPQMPPEPSADNGPSPMGVEASVVGQALPANLDSANRKDSA